MPPRHSGSWVGAPVESLRCHIVRPGKARINRVCPASIKKRLRSSTELR